MRVMLDTNILISALLFPSERMNLLISKIIAEHRLVLSSYVVDELLEVIARKFSRKIRTVELLLHRLPYEFVSTPEEPERGLFEIRDEDDYPVLYSAVTADVDVLVTGDRDFENLGLQRPEILTPAIFLTKY